MAETKNKNKVVYDGEVLIDLTADTVTPDKLAKGITAHDKSGATITGTSTKDSDTTDDTAAVAEILKGKTAHARWRRPHRTTTVKPMKSVRPIQQSASRRAARLKCTDTDTRPVQAAGAARQPLYIRFAVMDTTKQRHGAVRQKPAARLAYPAAS